MTYYGLLTRDTDDVGRSGFDRTCYEVKSTTGQTREPVADATSLLSCFGDTAATVDDPSLCAVSADGDPATRDRPYFDWSYVCPTREAYRDHLLSVIGECVAVSPNVRLDDVGFPRAEYCHCETCNARFAASDFETRADWRTAEITTFVEAAADRTPGRLSVTLYPDPYPGHLRKRSGIDVTALEPVVDEFVVTLFDTAYGTTYWLEVIASGFRDALETPMGVDLYAPTIDPARLTRAAAVVTAYADTVYFGYDVEIAQSVIENLDKD